MHKVCDTAPSAQRSGIASISAKLYLYTSRHFPPIRVNSGSPDGGAPDGQDLYEVRIIDNDHNTYQEVIEITMLALNITEEDAYAIAWEVDHRGSCVVAHAVKEEAEAIATIIRVIGIEVQMNRISSVASS
jgi:ATP-dependent Clp protease adapter protein ClpS